MEIETGFDLGTHTQMSNGMSSSRGLMRDATASAFALPDVIVALPCGVSGIAAVGAGAGGTAAIAGFGGSGAGAGSRSPPGKTQPTIAKCGRFLTPYLVLKVVSSSRTTG